MRIFMFYCLLSRFGCDACCFKFWCWITQTSVNWKFCPNWILPSLTQWRTSLADWFCASLASTKFLVLLSLAPSSPHTYRSTLHSLKSTPVLSSSVHLSCTSVLWPPSSRFLDSTTHNLALNYKAYCLFSSLLLLPSPGADHSLLQD